MDNGRPLGTQGSDELFRLVVEAAPNALVLVDSAGAIVLVNRHAENLFGYARQDLVGRKVEELLPAQVREHHPRLRREFGRGPSARPMGQGRDLHGLTRDGREVPIEIGLTPFEAAGGPYVLASVIDISERKAAEQSLRALNQSLAAQVRETQRMLEQLTLAQDQLVQAEKLASLGGLVAGVAHEINTPVGVGVTAASHLGEEVRALRKAAQAGTLTRAGFERYLRDFEQGSDIILLNLQRAAELIRGFKQVAVDQASEQKRRVNLRSYIGEVLLSLTPQLKGTAHRLLLDCPGDIEIETIPGALSQILTNFVVNALSHAFEPGRAGTMRIGVRQVEGTTEISFSDDGHGIPREHLTRIFDPFFTTRRGQGGTGLGLHIVFNLVHRTLGGRITVASEPGHGATFTLTF
jgi:PAS domain S-box-containing protein